MTNQSSILDGVGGFVERLLPEVAGDATLSLSGVELEPEAAANIANAHSYRALERMASDPAYPYRRGARLALDNLAEPEMYREDNAPGLEPAALQFYADAAEWVDDGAYRAMVGDAGDDLVQAALDIPSVAADGGKRTDGGRVTDGGITEEDIEPTEGFQADSWLDNLPLRLLGSAALISAAAGGVAYALWDSDNDGLRNYEEWIAPTDFRDSDTAGDGIEDGLSAELGLDPSKSHPEIGSLVGSLNDNGLSSTEKAWLSYVADNPHNIAPQVVEQGYHEDGVITAAELEQTRDSDDDALITALDPDDTNPDSDGDGFKDSVERMCLSDANASKIDVYVEIDRMKGVEPLTAQEKQRLVQLFEDAPVEGDGINLHLISDEEVPAHAPLEESGKYSSDWYRSKFFNHEGEGYHYSLLTISDPSDGGIRPGFGGGGNFTVPVMFQNQQGELTSYVSVEPLFAHELGHSVGLPHGASHNAGEGVKPGDVPFEEYPSLMNYNAPPGFMGFSNGSNSPNDFNDWRYIENHLFTPSTEQYWDNRTLEC